MGQIREPIKKSSIEKKNKIIEKGFELMCTKGYHNVTCVDIAKYAGVSTGIIYQYFKDKRDIFIEGVKDYSNKIMFPMIDILKENKFDKSNLKDVISRLIDSFIKTHTMSKKAHEELMAMSHLDSEIADIFHENEIRITDKISSELTKNGINTKNQKEKIHISIGLVDNLCHEVVYHKHDNLNYDLMKKEVVSLCVSIFKKKV